MLLKSVKSAMETNLNYLISSDILTYYLTNYAKTTTLQQVCKTVH